MSNWSVSEWPLILLFSAAALIPLWLVYWEIASMRRGPLRRQLRFGLRHLFILIGSCAVIAGSCRWFGWTIEVVVLTVAGLLIAAWARFLVPSIWRWATRKEDLIEKMRQPAREDISPPSAPGKKPPKRQRRYKSHQQPKYGRYGMWR